MGIQIHYDADLSLVQEKKVAIIGYGSQGHAHALNLRDSGVEVAVGLRSASPSAEKVREKGLAVMEIAEAVQWADVVMVLIPDQHHKRTYNQDIAPYLTKGKSLGVGHGFSIHYGEIKPPEFVDVFMVAPKSPGHLVRRVYEEGAGVPCLVAVSQNPTGTALDLALSYAKAIGGANAGVIETTFKDETETDLFGEQAVLCGGSEALIRAGFETLTEAGYPPELAYFEVLHELKLIVDLYYEGGLAYMNYSISDTAEYGNYTRGPRLITDAVRAEMKKILEEIQNGQFAKEWIEECDANWPNFDSLKKSSREHPIEKVGKKLRGMMSWLRPSKSADTANSPVTIES